jgi:D-alanyl-D-alanine carboxypeptidase
MRRPIRRAVGVTTVQLLALAAVAGCGGGSTAVEPDLGVATIEVTLSAPTVDAGATVSANATARNARGEVVPASFTWRSADDRIASVGPGGVVTGRAPGTTVLTAVASSVTGTAEISVRTRDISAIVEAVRAERGLPALAGAMVSTDGLLAAGVAGTRRVGGSNAVTIDDRWHIGSNLKALTAALAAIAVSRGSISWTTTVAEGFPELDGSIRPEYRSATLEDLLANRAGIRNDPPVSAYAGTTARQQRETLTAWALAAPPAAASGTYFYSNPGFVLAGAMVERALGGTYEALLASELGAPLGVGSISWGPTTGPGGINQPVGHRRQAGAWVACEACDNPPGLSAAGRANMTMPDWARLIQELLRADAGGSTLIGAEHGRRLFTGLTPLQGTSDTYGLGWIMTTRGWAGGRTATHSGSNTVNHSVAWLGLGTGIAFLAATNAADLDTGATRQALDAIVVRMLELYNTGN